MFERFTGAARDVVVRAQEESRQLRHAHIGTEHLLLALLAPEAGVSSRVLRAAGVDADHVRAEVERYLGSQPTAPSALSDEDAAALRAIGIDLHAVVSRIEETLGHDALAPGCPEPGRSRWTGRARRGWLRRHRGHGGGHRPFTPRAKKVLELSLREAIHLRHKEIGTQHLLLGLLREGEGLAARILVDAGVSLDELRRATLEARPEAA